MDKKFQVQMLFDHKSHLDCCPKSNPSGCVWYMNESHFAYCFVFLSVSLSIFQKNRNIEVKLELRLE